MSKGGGNTQGSRLGPPWVEKQMGRERLSLGNPLLPLGLTLLPGLA